MPIDLDRDLLPPVDLVVDGSSSMAGYIADGAAYMDFFREHLDLRPTMHVLDIGSSVGRIARNFVPFLAAEGRYDGIDIMPAQVAWCQEAISARFPNFRFIRADVYNATYNPQGTVKASAYRFPYEDNCKDLVFLTSVFTHMLRADVENYLAEIFRMLKPGGQCLATFFIYARDEFSRLATARQPFRYPIFKQDGFPVIMCADHLDLEDAVAYEREFILALCARSGLRLVKDLPGSWIRREGASAYQDVLIFSKPH